MPSIFSRIIAGELPGRFVWKDDRAVAFLSIAPMMPGHTLVVPRDEVDHWIDLEPALAAHLFAVAQQIGRAQQLEWKPARIGVLIVGEEVPHAHLHVVPINQPDELSFAHVDRVARSGRARRRGRPHPRPLARAGPHRGQRLSAVRRRSTRRGRADPPPEQVAAVDEHDACARHAPPAPRARVVSANAYGSSGSSTRSGASRATSSSVTSG